MVKLGAKVRDVISGLEGIAVGRAEYLNGCIQIAIEGPHHDRSRKTEWVDEQRVETIQENAFEPQPTAAMVGGEFQSTPPRDPV